MCLIALAWRPGAGIELLLVGNRDEFHQRPSAAASMRTGPTLRLGGQDIQSGGSWLEFVPGRRLATVTNVRQMPPEPARPRSRGALVDEFCAQTAGWAEFANTQENLASEYGRFNLLAWDGDALHYAGNTPHWHAQTVTPGIHALSNAELDSNWPKVTVARIAVQQWIAQHAVDPFAASFDALLAAFADRQPAADAALPDTGVGVELERQLAPVFIEGERYGTRCTSVVLQMQDGRWRFLERRYQPRGLDAGLSEWVGCDQAVLATR